MHGIQFKDLPTNLQQKLSQYMGVANSVEDAIQIAKQNGNWSESDTKQLSALNGDANWGKTMDEFSFNSNRAAEYKEAVAKAPKKQPKIYYAANEQAELDKKRNNLRNTIAQQKADGDYLSAFVNAFKYRSLPEKAGQENAGFGGKLAVYAAAALGAAVTVATMTSCEKDEVYAPHYTYNNNNTVNITNITDNSTLAEAQAEYNNLLKQQIELLEKIAKAEQDNATNLAELRAELAETNKKLDTVNSHLVAIITNQENQAKTAEEYYQLILNAVNNNSEFLVTIIDELTKSNATLSTIEELMRANNATDEEILEAITKVKFGVDKLGEDNEEIKKLLKSINVDLSKLPENLRAKFEGYFNSIILGIANNGDKLSELTKLLKLVNDNVVNGNKQQQEATEKVLALLVTLNCNMTSGLTAILKAVKDGNKNIIGRIDQILEKLTGIWEKLGEIKDDTGNIATNTEAIAKNQEEITQLVIKYGDSFADKFDKMLEKLNKISKNTDTMIANQTTIIELIKKYGDAFGDKLDTIINKFDGQADKFEEFLNYMKNMDANLEQLVTNTNTLVEQGVADKAVQDSTNKFVQDIYEKMSDLVINANIDLTPVIQAINAVTSQVHTSIQGLQDYIGENITGNVSDILSSVTTLIQILGFKAKDGKLETLKDKLDEILKAIVDHKILIKIENGKPTVEPTDPSNPCINEGVIEDINWLLAE